MEDKPFKHRDGERNWLETGEKEGNMKKLTLKTKEGCWRLMAITFVLILVFSLIAGIISTAGGRVSMEELRFDSRGGITTAELYTPRGISSEDKLPAIMILPGGGCTYRVTSGLAQELARRGFVVMNLNVNGAGNSENPPIDDMGLEPGVFNSTRGAKDALEYFRTLEYVDQTRIGLAGHSMGGLRTGGAVSADASYYTLNDLLINNLTDEFGISLDYEEITQDADTLAEKYLSEDQMVFYNKLKAEEEKYFSERVKAWFALGSNASVTAKTVTVGGYEVVREPQVNIGFSIGMYDETNRTKTFQFPEGIDTTYEGITTCLAPIFQTGETPVEPNVWYEVIPGYEVDEVPASSVVGSADELSATDDALSEAIENRSARVLFLTNESHSRNFFSVASAENLVHFFVDALEYNGGELNSAESSPIPYTNTVFMLRIACNFIAMLLMFSMILIFIVGITKEGKLAACILPSRAPINSKKNWGFWIVSAITIIVGIWAVKYVGGSDLGFENKLLKGSYFLPFSGAPLTTSSWMIWVNGAGLLALIVYSCVNKKMTVKDQIAYLGINIKVKSIFKSLLVAFLAIACGYMSLLIVKTAFNQHYRLWMSAFDVMSMARICAWVRYSLLALPLFFVNSCLTNIGKMKDMREGANLLLCIVINVAGVLIAAIINYGYMYATNLGPITTFFCTQWSLFLMIPVTTIISRLLFNKTNSIWTGTFVNAMLIAWLWVSVSDTSLYTGASIVARYFGF